MADETRAEKAAEAVAEAVTEAAEETAEVVQQVEDSAEAAIEAAEARAEAAEQTAEKITDAAMESERGREIASLRESQERWQDETAGRLVALEAENQSLKAGMEDLRNQFTAQVVLTQPTVTEETSTEENNETTDQSPSTPGASDTPQEIVEAIVEPEAASEALSTAPEEGAKRRRGWL